jgi:hypothetical protein
MHFKHSLLLICFAIAGLLSDNAFALPFNQPVGIVHLPLKPVEQRRRDLHPQIVSDMAVSKCPFVILIMRFIIAFEWNIFSSINRI